MDERRQRRIAEAIRDELSEMVVYELTDPRIRIAAVTDIDISPDGKKVDVLIRAEGDAKAQAATIEALSHANGFIRKELANRLSLRNVPDLRFRPDTGTESPERMEVLLKRAQKWRRKLDKSPDKEIARGGE